MADSTAMTVDFLRARLLSERSVSRAAKERGDQLAKRVAELEEQVRAVTAQRRQAERAATEVLGILESHGFGGHLSDVLDSGSDHDGEVDDDPREARSDSDTVGSRGEEKAAAPAQGEAKDALSGMAHPGGLSWKGRSVSPRKARQLKQKHRRSYFYLLSSDPSPKYRMGQSCRKNKRKELSDGRSAAPEEEGGDVVELVASQKRQQDGSDCTDEGQADMDGVVGGDDRSSGDGGGGQYVIRYEKDGEMERVLERQAELIGQYEAEEEAQRQWEKQFNENRSSTKGHVEAENKACQIENGWEQSTEHARLADQAVHFNKEAKSSVKNLSSASNNHSAGLLLNGSLPESTQNASGQAAAADQRDAHEEHHDHCHAQSQGSSNGIGRVTRQNQEREENPDGCSSYCAIKAPSDGSPSTSDATLNSKVSDWSSSCFHDSGDNQLGTRPDQQPRSNMDIESVLQALQYARISLSQKLSKPVPPSQVTLALPAPGDDEHTEEGRYSPVDDEFNSAREELCSSSPSHQEILALPAPEDYHERGQDLPVNDTTILLTEEPASSSPHREEILALPAPGNNCHGEIVEDIKMPICTAGFFRLPTDSFPKDEMLSSCSKYGSELNVRPTATNQQKAFASDTAHVTVAPSVIRDDHGFSAKQCYDSHSSVLLSVPTSGRCSTLSSDFNIGGVSFLSGISGLAEDFREGRPFSDADLFMQRGCDYTISNKWML
ncbi:hypothetical protein E2562_032158 [Oryza meyeriana var. granulata]|uniref:Uncharacterized protein n=1 Tax=Oryza meyeriana var. granulata TaxID=110450 RepID=A0A6G1E7F3_9ORYZ|nr:hypothetical protein E2562_032158 [Oryza meyeriana var. granulata]